MNKVQIRPPSFPGVTSDTVLSFEPQKEWQVLCGDRDHWRVGIYSPPQTRAGECKQLEQHDCPELFLLLSGRLTLLLRKGDSVELLPLREGEPILVKAPHAGFCPAGPHTGVAVVVERDAFDTEYFPCEA